MERGVEALRAVFERNFEERGEVGASVSVWKAGEELISLSRGVSDKRSGAPWTHDTLIPFYSATKGPAAATALHALSKEGLELESCVARVWPEFSQGGKDKVTFGQLMSHQAGLAAMPERASTFDHESTVEILARQEPNWVPGTKHGYHARTFGFLLDEIVRRLTGCQCLGDYWREAIAIPLQLDLWIGLPEGEFSRVGTLYPGKSENTPAEQEFYRAFADPTSLSKRAFISPGGLHSIAQMNEPKAWQAGLPAMGGVGTAGALGKFYGILAAGGGEIFSPEILEWMKTKLVDGDDQVLLLPTAFSAGFMMDPVDSRGEKRRKIFGPGKRAFGHPGAGGSHAFADPEAGISFAYTMNQMELGVLPNVKALEMVEALFGE